MARNLIYISDGTLSSLRRGHETNAGQLLRLLEEVGQRPGQLFDYDRGVQGRGLRKWINAASGKGVNLSVLRGYAFLCQRYRPGDRIYLFGYSRGAYAVRSLGGMIGHLGLLKPEEAGERRLREAFVLYMSRDHRAMATFAGRYSIRDVPIRMIGVWDTVRALGLPVPLFAPLSPVATQFHDHSLGAHISYGFHALAIDEDRVAFRPILWRQSPEWHGRLEQAWFPGAHGDVGGHLHQLQSARPLSNIPLNWMLAHADRHGVLLPDGWDQRFAEDAAAPMQGCHRGIAGAFLSRAPRDAEDADGAVLHLSIAERMRADPSYRPRGAVGLDYMTQAPAEVS
ncbi:MAG: DUF2235 domain-containing protein [Pseudomonadota bacterium]